MTARNAGKGFAVEPAQRIVIKEHTTRLKPIARCQQCPWSQVDALTAEVRLHVRNHPTHSVGITRVQSTWVCAEDGDGVLLTEDRHG